LESIHAWCEKGSDPTSLGTNMCVH